MNPLATKEQSNNLFNLKSSNDLKKDQTKIKIIKNSFFDSNLNSVQSLYPNLSHSSLHSHSSPCASDASDLFSKTDPRSALAGGAVLERSTKNGAIKKAPLSIYPKGPSLNSYFSLPLKLKVSKKRGVAIRGVTKGDGSYPKISAIFRAIRTIRLNRDEWKLIKYINLIEKKIRSNPLFACPSLPYGMEGEGEKITRGGVFSKLSPSSLSAPPSLAQGRLREKLSSRGKKMKKNFLLKQRDLPLAGAAQEHYKKIFTYNNIINKNILLRNMKYSFLKSVLSSILKKRIRKMSEILEDKPIKNYVLYSYLKNCIFTPSQLTPSLNNTVFQFSQNFEKGGVVPPKGCTFPRGGAEGVGIRRTKLSLNKYKGRKFGSFINYNKIIGFNFNSTALPLATKEQPPFYQAFPNCLALFARAVQEPKKISQIFARGAHLHLPKVGKSLSCNRYIKDTYKLLFYLFKSMYCLISKPVLRYTNDKVTIQLFYYLNIPKKKIFRLFSISYIKSIKKKWLAQSTTAHSPSYPIAQLHFSRWPKARSHSYGGMGRYAGHTKLNIRWKLRKAISRLKNKFISSTGGGGKNLLFFLRKFNLTKVYQKKFKLICAILSKIFNKPVELQLIRLHHPYHDSNILVNLLSLNIKNKRKKARVAIQKIYNKKPVKNLNDPNLKKPALLTADSFATQGRGSGKIIPAFLSGLNIKINGRLMGEPIIPRITTKVFNKGASATGKVNFLDVARITKKNRKGAYTIKITSGQNFF